MPGRGNSTLRVTRQEPNATIEKGFETDAPRPSTSLPATPALSSRLKAGSLTASSGSGPAGTPGLTAAFGDAARATIPEPTLAIAHRWRYALPLSLLGKRGLLEPDLGLGACGVGVPGRESRALT